MNAEKIITTTEPIDIDIQGITLLSVEEVEQLPDEMRTATETWWLRSPGDIDDGAADVFGDDGDVNVYGNYVRNTLGVRPALIISNLESSNLEEGDKIQYRGYAWTVILGKYALCDSIIAQKQFREDWKADDANDYEKSDVKKYIEDWLKEVDQ